MLNIQFTSSVYNNHSLSIVTRKLALELAKNKNLNISIAATDSYNPEYKLTREELLLLKPLVNKTLPKVDIEVRHSYPPNLVWPTDSKTKIVYIQPWEYNRMPIEWKNTFSDFSDLVVVPSTWVAEIYKQAGIPPNKISVVPNGYDPSIFNTEPSDCPFFDKNKFVFTFVGNAQFRKGVDILLQAWHKSFVKADNAVLFIKDTPSVYGQTNLLENSIQLQYKTGCAKIVYNDDLLSETDMAKIYKNSSALVHPYRGEGFGMHIQEAMACGTLPIVTGVGSANDFVTEECGIKINARKMFIDSNDPKYFIGKPGDSYTNMGSHFWVPEPDVEDLANKMRFLYHHHERDKILTKVNQSKLFTWEYAASKFLEAVQKVDKLKGTPQRYK